MSRCSRRIETTGLARPMMAIPTQSTAILAAVLLTAVGLGQAGAQDVLRRIAVKNGESVDLGVVYWVANCHSIMVGLPEIEMLEGPPGVTLSIREEPVLPRRQGCADKVPGGTVVLTAKEVTERSDTKLTYRVKYKIKDGPRQTSQSYMISLFP
jgi:hypothetical protein